MTPWAVASQALLSMEFSRQEYWSAVVTAKSLQLCPTVWPHRHQPTRLPRLWDSSGKNTGVGCHFLLQCMKVKSESEVPQLCPTLSNPIDFSPPGCSVLGIFQARVLEWVPLDFFISDGDLLDSSALVLSPCNTEGTQEQSGVPSGGCSQSNSYFTLH